MSNANRKRRGDEWRLVDINELPALTSLDPDALKNFTKDELRSYLKAYSIEPAESKPDMKRQLRSLIFQAQKGQLPAVVGGYATSSHGEAAPVVSAAPAGHHTAAVQPEFVHNTGSNHGVPIMAASNVIVDHVVENIAPNFTGFGGDVDIHQAFQAMTNPNTMHSSQKLDMIDEGICVGCGKRANKDCKYQRCKACCNAANYKCSVHARNFTPVAGVPTGGPVMTTPTQTYTPSMFTAPASIIQTIDTMPPPPLPERLIAPVIPDFHSLSGGGITSTNTIDITGAAAGYSTGLAQPPPYLNEVTSTQLDKLQDYKDKTVTCPNCKQSIVAVGTNFLTHYKQCDPDGYETYLNNPHTVDTLKREAPVDSEKERAIKRMKLNNESIQEVFAADQPVEGVYNNVIDANKSLLDEKSARLEQKEKSEKELTEESDNMNKFMEQLQQQQDLSAIFAEFDKCQTPEEIQQVKMKYNIQDDMPLSSSTDSSAVAPLATDEKYANHATDLTSL
jgi:LRP1 type putative zinc finger protein